MLVFWDPESCIQQCSAAVTHWYHKLCQPQESAWGWQQGWAAGSALELVTEPPAWPVSGTEWAS